MLAMPAPVTFTTTVVGRSGLPACAVVLVSAGDSENAPATVTLSCEYNTGCSLPNA